MLDSIHMNKIDLLDIVRENRKNHVDKYNEAITSWQIHYQEVLDQLGKRVREQRVYIPLQSINLPKPVSYEECYDEVIKMLELSIDKEVDLCDDEFRKLVMDKWNWRNTFDVTNSTYFSSSSSSSDSSSSSSLVTSLLDKIEKEILNS